MQIPGGSSDSALAKIDPIARADLGVGPGGSAPPSVVYQIFQNYMFNIGSRHLLNCISENFNLENFSGGACARNSLEKCAVRSPDGRYRVHIATVYCISRAPYITKSSLRPSIKTLRTVLIVWFTVMCF